MYNHKCEKCGGSCRALPVACRIEASEWYCEKCHKSYPMDKAVAMELLAQGIGA